MKIIYVLALLFFILTGVQAGVPVFVGGEPDLDACDSIGMVAGLDPYGDGFLAVRDGPSSEYRKIDELHNGDQVILCDQRGDWYGVVYSRSSRDCGVSSPISRRIAYSGPCQSGWVFEKYIVDPGSQHNLNQGSRPSRPGSAIDNGADSCFDLWLQRNQIMANKGYCFTTPLGKRHFAHYKCWTSSPRLTWQEQATVDHIRAKERQLGCRVN
jgi:hypothetical protein